MTPRHICSSCLGKLFHSTVYCPTDLQILFLHLVHLNKSRGKNKNRGQKKGDWVLFFIHIVNRTQFSFRSTLALITRQSSGRTLCSQWTGWSERHPGWTWSEPSQDHLCSVWFTLNCAHMCFNWSLSALRGLKRPRCENTLRHWIPNHRNSEDGYRERWTAGRIILHSGWCHTNVNLSRVCSEPGGYTDAATPAERAQFASPLASTSWSISSRAALVLGKHSHARRHLAKFAAEPWAATAGKGGQRGHGGEQKERGDRRSGIKGPISLEIYTDGDVLGGGQISWIWPPPRLPPPHFSLSGTYYQGLTEPVCFHSRHAERALSSKWISPQFLLCGSSFFLPNVTVCQLCAGVSDSSLSAQHV